MSATTINNYSVELNQGPPGTPGTYAPLRPNQLQGRVRRIMFTYTAASDASGQNIALAKIPKGARLTQVNIAVSASTGSATLAFGLAGANGNGYIDDGNVFSGQSGSGITGADSIGAQVADSTTCIAAAAAHTSANTLITLITPTPSAYAASPAAEGVINISNSAWLYMTAKDVLLTMTVGTASLTTQIIQGYLDYVVD